MLGMVIVLMKEFSEKCLKGVMIKIVAEWSTMK